MLALAYASSGWRDDVALLFELDARLGSLVSGAHAPQLARIRLAWWSEAVDSLHQPAMDRRDPLLANLAGLVERYPAIADQLGGLVDGWDALLDALPLGDSELETYLKMRGEGLFENVCLLAGRNKVAGAGRAFALADFASHCADQLTREKALAFEVGPSLPGLPRSLAILDRWAMDDIQRLRLGQPIASLARKTGQAMKFALFHR